MLLWGAAAVAVPIIIHLINRRRFKRVIWAAMKFVQLSIDQNQRRMKLEDWILLFLRCAMLVLLALALARPRMTGTQSTFLGGEGEVASVLVLDEATSALDNATEQSVMRSIEGLNQDLTILIIAHRLTTVQHCDFIVELEHGQVVAQGTYKQLRESSPSFREMTQSGEKGTPRY